MCADKNIQPQSAILLPIQEEYAQKLLDKRGVDPQRFLRVTEKSKHMRDTVVTKLVHESGRYYFVFDWSDPNSWRPRMFPYPNEVGEHEEYWDSDDYSVTDFKFPSSFRKWAEFVAKNLKAAPVWSPLSAVGEAALLPSPLDQIGSRSFTGEERRKISSSITDLKRQLQRSRQYSSADLALITDRLSYLEEAAGRLNRRDWVMVVVGVTVNTVSTLHLSPDLGDELMRAISDTFKWIAGGQPLLPG